MKNLYKIIKNKKGQAAFEIHKVLRIIFLLIILAIIIMIIIMVSKKFLSPAPSEISKLINRGGG